VNRALETVEGVPNTIAHDLDAFVVFVAATFASFHDRHSPCPVTRHHMIVGLTVRAGDRPIAERRIGRLPRTPLTSFPPARSLRPVDWTRSEGSFDRSTDRSDRGAVRLPVCGRSHHLSMRQ